MLTDLELNAKNDSGIPLSGRNGDFVEVRLLSLAGMALAPTGSICNIT